MRPQYARLGVPAAIPDNTAKPSRMKFAEPVAFETPRYASVVQVPGMRNGSWRAFTAWRISIAIARPKNKDYQEHNDHAARAALRNLACTLMRGREENIGEAETIRAKTHCTLMCGREENSLGDVEIEWAIPEKVPTLESWRGGMMSAS
ncbi:hypothetical protein [Microvirga thermotolerans]|uniref:Uncharacterized protein n=1 Tax=Microvirga thermotolerans TaxID=2651334 RepID=A0A5P9K5N6_9HYPH|nr:hypothetical protein [Microvirga thermotolerans]QFU17884.1 hypothetical protein GDR74_17615 [Microvirga thermotolerans]